MKILVNVGLAGFLLWTAPMVILYFALLWEKIQKPHFKNMNDKEVVYFGIIAIVIVILDILIVKRFIGLLRKK